MKTEAAGLLIWNISPTTKTMATQATMSAWFWMTNSWLKTGGFLVFFPLTTILACKRPVSEQLSVVVESSQWQPTVANLSQERIWNLPSDADPVELMKVVALQQAVAEFKSVSFDIQVKINSCPELFSEAFSTVLFHYYWT